jgi:hypothetical protein
MYIRVYERLGQPPEIVREFEEDKRRFEMRKAEHKKRLASLKKFQFMWQCPGGTESIQSYKLPFNRPNEISPRRMLHTYLRFYADLQRGNSTYDLT